jgi:hypothetical protein
MKTFALTTFIFAASIYGYGCPGVVSNMLDADVATNEPEVTEAAPSDVDPEVEEGSQPVQPEQSSVNTEDPTTSETENPGVTSDTEVPISL